MTILSWPTAAERDAHKAAGRIIEIPQPDDQPDQQELLAIVRTLQSRPMRDAR